MPTATPTRCSPPPVGRTPSWTTGGRTGLRRAAGKRVWRRAGRGAAAADLDGDGDLDLVVTQNGGSLLLLRNEGGNRNRWLEVEPRGLHSNKDGIGTKVEVLTGPAWQRRETLGGGGYLSQSPPLAHFGLGERALADG